ncbi:MAG TPA: Calx-beta domain-containing protein [Acidimicrobiales bacterium]|nr:Calx-beta domain-containing protein [Acidimicrobiales bacterium]
MAPREVPVRSSRLPLLRRVVAIALSIVGLASFAVPPAGAQSPNTVSITDAYGGEGDDIIVFSLTRAKATGRSLSVAYETADGDALAGADYQATSGTVTFPPRVTMATLAVTVFDDALDESDETFRLVLRPAAGVAASRPSATGTILDNDVPEVPTRPLSVTDLGTPGPRSLTGYEISSGKAITSRGQIAGATRTPFYENFAFTWEGGSVEATWSTGGTARSGPQLEDMNANEEAVGAMGGEPSHAFLWQNGTMRGLGTPFGDDAYKWSTAQGINDRGQIVGSAGDYVGIRAFLWDNGAFTDLGSLGGSYTEAEDINGAGQIVGGSTTASGVRRAFLWEAGGMVDLGTLGGPSSQATAINDMGQIVGQSQTASGAWRPFLWEGGRMTDLGTLGGAAIAYDINNGGQVVGASEIASGQFRGFLWDNGTLWRLPDLEGPPDDSYDHTVARAINDSGHIVGMSKRHTVLWA